MKQKKVWILLLTPILAIVIVIIAIPLGSLLLEYFTVPYHQDIILITREFKPEDITEPITNLTSDDLESVPKLLSALQEMAQNETILQKIIKITGEERDLILQLFEQINLPLSTDPQYVYFENACFEVAISAVVS